MPDMIADLPYEILLADVGRGTLLVISGVFVVWVLVGIFLIPSGRKRARRQHLQDHPEISQEQFLREVGVEPHKAFIVLGVREAFARTMKVPAPSVYPTDTLDYVGKFQFTGGLDWLELILYLCETLRIERKSIDEQLKKQPPAPPETVADTARWFVSNWDKFSPAREL